MKLTSPGLGVKASANGLGSSGKLGPPPTNGLGKPPAAAGGLAGVEVASLPPKGLGSSGNLGPSPPPNGLGKPPAACAASATGAGGGGGGAGGGGGGAGGGAGG